MQTHHNINQKNWITIISNKKRQNMQVLAKHGINLNHTRYISAKDENQAQYLLSLCLKYNTSSLVLVDQIIDNNKINNPFAIPIIKLEKIMKYNIDLAIRNYQ